MREPPFRFSSLPHLWNIRPAYSQRACDFRSRARSAHLPPSLPAHRQDGEPLRAMGIGRHDRVAVVLPNGPEMAVAVFAVAACAVCAPVNPAFGPRNWIDISPICEPRALITQAGIDSPARRVALSRGIRVIELSTASMRRPVSSRLRETTEVHRPTRRSAPATWRCCCSRQARRRGPRSSRRRTPTSVRRLAPGRGTGADRN